jgi:hypothetical protein
LQYPLVLFRNLRIIHELFFGSLSPLFIVSYRHGTITSLLVLNVVLEEWEPGAFNFWYYAPTGDSSVRATHPDPSKALL